ncbi:hypothetical protein E2542_SST26849 [Spatholobus suberectus]|nr:hypothetical protein E2542_SST26849 [Spatholobus suberectus]
MSEEQAFLKFCSLHLGAFFGYHFSVDYHSDFLTPLMDSYVYESKNYFGMLAGSVDSQQDKDTYKSSWKISKSRNGHILRKLLSQFIKEIVEGMIGFVNLPTIMFKLLSDNGSQEFGDFKLTILGMLGTYGFERKILVRLTCSFLFIYIFNLIL